MHNLSINVRLLLILFVLLIPISMLVYNLSAALNKSISFAELQLEGVDYEKPLLVLLNEIADYQLAELQREHGEPGLEEEIKEGAASIDAVFAEADIIDQRVARDLKLTVQDEGDPNLTLAATKQKWEAIKAGAYNAEAYTILLRDLAGMVKRLGENSNMILDPELDSFTWLMHRSVRFRGHWQNSPILSPIFTAA